MGFPKPISFPAPWRNSPLCGSYLDLQESEISILLREPTLSLEQVVDRVRPAAIAGFSSGIDLANDTVLRNIAKSGRAKNTVQLNKAAASMIHSSPPNPKQVIPKAGEYTMLDQKSAEQIKPQLIAALTQQLKLKGDPGLAATNAVAAQIIDEAFRRLAANYDVSGTDPFRELLTNILGVDIWGPTIIGT